MRRLFFLVFLVCTLLASCTLSHRAGPSAGTGNPGNSLLSDPLVGLNGLDDYTATLKVSFKGTRAGQALDSMDTYVQSEWPQLAAQFLTTDTTGSNGAHQVVLIGAVGDAQYSQADPSTPCTVDWGPTAGGPSAFQPASLLPAVNTAKLVDEPTLDGIPVRHYTMDGASLGLSGDATASGEFWVAKDGGYLMKYILDITGGDSFFGSGIQGTRHLEYILSGIGVNPHVVYPAGCDPVLDLPAMDDASDLSRLPGQLSFSTNSSADNVFAFYLDKLIALGWQKSSDVGLGSDLASTTFTRADSNSIAIVEVNAEGSSHRVNLIIFAEQTPGTASAITPVVTPLASNSIPLPTLDITSLNLPAGLTIYPGATGLQTSSADPSGSGLRFVIFHTADSPDQVVAYYQKQLTGAGWKSTDQQTPTPDASGRVNYGWESNGWIVTITPDIDPQGGSSVMITWIKF